MGVVEDIVAAIILLFILLISGLVYTMTIAKDSVHNIDVTEDVFFDDRYQNTLFTVSKVTEPISQKELGVLLANAVYYRNTTPSFNGVAVNVTDKFKELLDAELGEDNYYLELKPQIVEISLNFVIDGSKTLNEERQTLSDNLPVLLSNLEKKVNKTGNMRKVVANIFMLPNKNNNPCNDVFNLSDPRIRCMVITEAELYYHSNSTNTSGDNFSYSVDSLDYFKMKYNLSIPVANNDYSEFIQHKAKSDWATGVTYASYYNREIDMSRFTLLFPMSDQLSTSSVAGECFTRTQYCEYSVCSICNDVCPVNRSLLTVTRAINAILNESTHVINPILSYNCDYQNVYFFGEDTYDTATIDSGWNACDLNNNYVKNSFGTDPAPTWCDKPLCPGCRDNAGDICFHEECIEDIKNQMNLMANATNGQMLELNNILNMSFNIEQIIQNNIEQFTITIGNKHPGERMVVEFSPPTQNNLYVDYRLGVYKRNIN